MFGEMNSFYTGLFYHLSNMYTMKIFICIYIMLLCITNAYAIFTSKNVCY